MLRILSRARPGGGISITDHVFGDSRRANVGDQPLVNNGSSLLSVPGRAEADPHVNRRSISPLGRGRIAEA